MADIKATSLGGVPKGTTAQRPTSPSVGDVFYNGTLGCLEIYTSQGWVANSAPPGIPDIGTATYTATNQAYNNASATVTFTPGQGGGLPNSYRATSTPGGYSGTATSSPITINGLQSATAYTFSITGTNNFGTSAASISSNSVTANTVPQAPTIGTLSYVSSTSLSLSFTANATGGSAITNYKYSTDGTNYTAFSPALTSGPITFTGLTSNTSYSFYLKAINANGDSLPSSISNSVITGPVVTGGTLSSDSTYYYRTFTGNGSLVVSGASLSCDILVVAGGGAGGQGSRGGAGGAGGLLGFTSQNISAGTYNCTIGGGGTVGAYVDNTGATNNSTNGIDSQFGSLTLVKGGGRGGANDSVGVGGSGGDGGSAGSAWYVNPNGTPVTGQGNAAGISYSSGSNYGSGGGGGAGGVGQNGTSLVGGAGGIGSSTYSSWGIATSTGHNVGGVRYYAGGGGGDTYGGYSRGSGAGGYGGGGSGNNTSPTGQSGTAGTSNTGGGGGAGGSGGSGIIIVRYTKASVGG